MADNDFLHRHEFDIEVRTPSQEAVALAALDHQSAQLDAYQRASDQKKQTLAIRREQILETPRFTRPGWTIAIIVEIIAVLFALSVLFSSGVGFTRTSVCFAVAAVLIPNAIIAGVYAIQDVDIKKSARNLL